MDAGSSLSPAASPALCRNNSEAGGRAVKTAEFTGKSIITAKSEVRGQFFDYSKNTSQMIQLFFFLFFLANLYKTDYFTKHKSLNVLFI